MSTQVYYEKFKKTVHVIKAIGVNLGGDSGVEGMILGARDPPIAFEDKALLLEDKKEEAALTTEVIQ